MFEQFPPLQEFMIRNWSSFADFENFINDTQNISHPLFLEAEGVIYLQKNMNNHVYRDVFYLFKLNNRLFASIIKENRETYKKYFDGLCELTFDLLTGHTFLEAKQNNYNTRYKELGTKVEVDCKSYIYHDEHKLLFSKAGKVDLLYSHQLVIKDDNVNLAVQTYPSLEQTVQWQKKRDLINERTQQIIDAKKK